MLCHFRINQLAKCRFYLHNVCAKIHFIGAQNHRNNRAVAGQKVTIISTAKIILELPK